MAGSLFCLLLLTLTLANVAALKAIPKSEPEFRAAMMRRLHRNGPPDLQAIKAAYDARPRPMATTYTSAGYINNGIYSDEKCTTMDVFFGTPVNTCFVEEGYAYMYRLTQNSCVGAVIEYYFDKQCTQLAGTSAPSDPVVAFPQCSSIQREISAATVCTSSSQPYVTQQSYIQQFFTGASCGEGEGYIAIPTGTCNESGGSGYYDDDHDDPDPDTMLTCSGSTVVVNQYLAGSGCAFKTGSYAIPTVCLTDDDDASYGARAASTLRGPVQDGDATSVKAKTDRAIDRLNDKLLAPAQRKAAAAKAHPAASVDASVAANAGKRQRPAKASGPVPSMVPAPIPATTPGTTQTDDDVNYYDDDGDDRTYVYDDYVYIYPHDDQDFGYQFEGYGDDISIDDLFAPPLNPPPSVQSTPFPTTPDELNPAESLRVFCQNPPTHNAVFSVTQGIEGVTLAQFNADLGAYTRTVAQTVAAVVQGATQSSVSGLVVTDASASAVTALTALFLPAAYRQAGSTVHPLAGSGVVLTYKVTVQGTPLPTDTLAGQLEAAVASGTFDTYLNSFAIANGATGLETATSSSVTTQSLPDAHSDSGSDNSLSAGVIAGIVIGCVVAVALIVAGLVFWCSSRPSTAMAAAAADTSARTNPTTEL